VKGKYENSCVVVIVCCLWNFYEFYSSMFNPYLRLPCKNAMNKIYWRRGNTVWQIWGKEIERNQREETREREREREREGKEVFRSEKSQNLRCCNLLLLGSESMSFIFFIKIMGGWEKNYSVLSFMSLNVKMNMIEWRWRRGRGRREVQIFLENFKKLISK